MFKYLCMNMLSRLLFRACPALTVTAALAAPLPAFGQPAAQLTLGAAVRQVLAQAPALRGAEATVAAAQADVDAARQLPNPTLSVDVENVLGSGPYARFNGSETTYALSMPLELGGKRAARTRVALAGQHGARIEAEAAKAEAALKVTQAFIALAAGERRLEAARTRRQLAEQAEHAAQARVRAGKVSPIDEQRAAAQRIGADVAAARAARALDLARARLARLAGLAQPFAIAAPWFEDAGNASIPDAHGVPPQLAAAQAQLDAAGARADAARRARIPDLSVSAGTRRFRD
ncbi:MAG: TolC family protein, partial [Lysobacteraceae bacterium]